MYWIGYAILGLCIIVLIVFLIPCRWRLEDRQENSACRFCAYNEDCKARWKLERELEEAQKSSDAEPEPDAGDDDAGDETPDK